MERVKGFHYSNTKTKTAPASAGAAQFLIHDLRLEGSAGSNSNILSLRFFLPSIPFNRALITIDNIQCEAPDLPTAIGNGEDIAEVSAYDSPYPHWHRQ